MAITKYFEEKQFYASKYPTTVSQIIKIEEYLSRYEEYENRGFQEIMK